MTSRTANLCLHDRTAVSNLSLTGEVFYEKKKPPKKKPPFIDRYISERINGDDDR